MHEADRVFWRQTRERHPGLFRGRRVLECGSYNINGSVREWFDECNYTGLDWRPGPGVDHVSLVHEAKFEPRSFDVVISSSMLEHDPHWERSLAAMAGWVSEDGALLLSWGCATNHPHEIHTAPDGEFHALPAAYGLRILVQNDLRIHRFVYQDTLPAGDGHGYVGVMAVRKPSLFGEREEVQPLRSEDH